MTHQVLGGCRVVTTVGSKARPWGQVLLNTAVHAGAEVKLNVESETYNITFLTNNIAELLYFTSPNTASVIINAADL